MMGLQLNIGGTAMQNLDIGAESCDTNSKVIIIS